MQENILLVGCTFGAESGNKLQAMQESFPSHRIAYCGISDICSYLQGKDISCSAAVITVSSEQERQCFDALVALKSAYPDVPVIMLIPYGNEEFASRAVQLGAHDFMVMPVTIEKLRLCLQHAITMRRMQDHISKLEKYITSFGEQASAEQPRMMLSNMSNFILDGSGHIKPMVKLEQEIIQIALNHSKGCISRAARELGIGRSTLYRKVDMIKNNGVQVARDNHDMRPMMSMSSKAHSASE